MTKGFDRFMCIKHYYTHELLKNLKIQCFLRDVYKNSEILEYKHTVIRQAGWSTHLSAICSIPSSLQEL